MERGAPHPSLAPRRPHTDRDALCFPGLADKSSLFSPLSLEYGGVDAAHTLQGLALRPTHPPLAPTMAHALPTPLPATHASLAVASPRQVYRASPDCTLYSTALEQAPTLRHMPMSPATSPKPTMVLPTMVPLGRGGGGIRWTPRAEETASGDHYGHNHLSLPRAPPRAQSRHSELSKRRRLDGDTGETPYHLTRPEVDEWRASAMAEADVISGLANSVPPGVGAEHPSDTLPTPRAGNAAHHCPSYVKQRQEHWNIVMNKTDSVDVAGSATIEEDGAHVAGHVSVLTPRHRDLTLHAPAPPPSERQTLAGVYGYRGGLNGPVCGVVSLIHASVLPDGADGTEPPSRKRRAQLVDEATDIWGAVAAAYNVPAGCDGWE
eukprot:TRINITY_DN487_c0_g1_i12.p1 TRINITY_DN487_c0_g1~~TRINITY_DN487_c0_g1_i12.p1  ORF type:complete len:378 (-),score=45.67 TRINITY_DN487_c0_g1_i12:32-1165(-)